MVSPKWGLNSHPTVLELSSESQDHQAVQIHKYMLKSIADCYVLLVMKTQNSIINQYNISISVTKHMKDTCGNDSSDTYLLKPTIIFTTRGLPVTKSDILSTFDLENLNMVNINILNKVLLQIFVKLFSLQLLSHCKKAMSKI